jgi:cell division protein FtsL
MRPATKPATKVSIRPAAPSEAKAVVEPGGSKQRLNIGLIALVILGLTLVAVAHVAVHAKRIEVAIALGKQEQAFREFVAERRQLEIEIGMLKDPARIIAIARDQLGMRPPETMDIHAAKPGPGARKR